MRRLILCALLGILAVSPATAQITYSTRAADSATLRRTSSIASALEAALGRMLAAFDSAQRVAARAQLVAERERYIRDSVLARILSAVSAPAPTPTPEPTPPPVVTPPPSGVQPWKSDDFSSYTSTSQLLASPLYGETSNPAQISLDPNVGLVQGGKSMRYTFPDRTAEGTTDGYNGYCTSYVISRAIPVPDTVKHIWYEEWVRFDRHFTTSAPDSWGCRSGSDYKYLFVVPSPNADRQYGRWQIDMPGWKYVVAYPGMPLGDASVPDQYAQPPITLADSLLPSHRWSNGLWTRYRIEARVSSCPTCADGLARIWVQDTKMWERVNVVIDRPSISAIAMGANLNKGPQIPQSLWRGKWAIYIQNPGW